ncbi:MAG: glutathione peroxidase [Pseudomonadota bacterium]
MLLTVAAIISSLVISVAPSADDARATDIDAIRLAQAGDAPDAGKRASGETKRAHTAYDFTLTAINGAPMPLSKYEGKAILLVNTASLCGYTDQYGGLQALYETYSKRGLVVIAAPSNDFGGQEPGAEAEIKAFCEVNFGVRFPLAEKVTVTGATAHPVYLWAREALGAENAPRWNFHKYLIGRDGALIAAFPSNVTPMSRTLRDAVEAAL